MPIRKYPPELKERAVRLCQDSPGRPLAQIADQRLALVTSFESGVNQKDLAVQYGISIRSVKRLVSAAREAGVITSYPGAL